MLLSTEQTHTVKKQMNREPKAASYALFTAFFIISTAVIIFSPGSFLYDEGYYYEYVSQLDSKGLNLTYIEEIGGPPGPLYGLVHKSLAAVTSLQVVPMRLATNVMFALAGMVVGCALWITRSGNFSGAPALAYAVPFAGVAFGLALTEVPALLAASAGVATLVGGLALIERNKTGAGSLPGSTPLAAYLLFVLAAVLFAASVWGRQNYLAALIALPLLFFTDSRFLWRPWLLVTGIATGLSAVLFLIWNGLVPEAVRFVSDGSKMDQKADVFFGMNIGYGILSLGYAAAMFGVLAPSLFCRRLSVLVSCFIAAVLAAVILPSLRFLPSYDALGPVLGPLLKPLAMVFFGALLAFFGFWLLVSVCVRCWERMKQEERSALSRGEVHGKKCGRTRFLSAIAASSLNIRFYLFGAAAWLLILGTNMKIGHQFSSRYVVVALPFILITAAHHFRPTPIAAARLAVGFVASMAFLAKKYNWWG
jgi:hypothetical protein